MNKRSIPIAILSCILAVAGMAGYFMPTATGPEPARLLMENPGGRVVFTHNAHSAPGGPYGDIACADCHHELKVAPQLMTQDGRAEVMLCTACHGTAEDPAFKVAHQELYRAKGGDESCVTCHHGSMAGFSKLWSHQEHKETYADGDCQACHHEERYEYGDGKVMNIKPQKCSNCHTKKPNPLASTTLKDAAHAKCASCHSDLFESGAEGCATCHNLLSNAKALAEGSFDKNYTSCSACHATIPGSMDAFHGNCMSCHDKKGKGPGKAAPCAQCHAP